MQHLDVNLHAANHQRSRRQFLRGAGNGFGALALSWMLHAEARCDDPGLIAHGGASGQGPHHKPTAKRVIYLFMHGGPSHIDTFDPKPDLQRLDGQLLPSSFGPVTTKGNLAGSPLLATRRTFSKHGQCGTEVSDLLPHIATCVDDIAVIRSCRADSVDHAQAIYQMNTGSIAMGRPSLGSWSSYGLGTENQNLPSFVVLSHPRGGIKGGALAYGAGYLPASHQGTVVRPGAVPIRDINPTSEMSGTRQQRLCAMLGQLNARHLSSHGNDSELSSRIQAYELAYRMQGEAPGVVDLSSETDATKRLYGLDDRETADFGSRCLMARRMVEKGVRFVQVYSGDVIGWDAHDDLERNHGQMCRAIDKPVAGLLKDLKSRGLLEETLVIWGGEFGRTPMSENGIGRDHNPHGFTVWMAGGGIKGGIIHGSTDAVGLRAESDPVHVHDLHATILHTMGINHERLTFSHLGRDERLTDTAGKVVRKILS